MDELDIAATIYTLCVLMLCLGRRSRYDFTFSFDHRGERVEVHVLQIPPSRIQEYYDAADHLVAEVQYENSQEKGKSV